MAEDLWASARALSGGRTKAIFFIAAIFAPVALRAQAAHSPLSLRVVDTKGVEVVVTDARIDYGGVLTAGVSLNDIGLQEGDGAVSLK